MSNDKKAKAPGIEITEGKPLYGSIIKKRNKDDDEDE